MIKLSWYKMKVAIMQPYFFPYIGYLSLIKHTDQFILLDEVQFIRHGWIERNRILKPGSGWQYISVPLKKKSFTTSIKDVEINNTTDWKDKILRQLAHYKKRALYYNKTMAVVEKALAIETDSISKLNSHILSTICTYLGISGDITTFSDLNMDIDTPNAPDEWALNICKKMPGVTEYWNPIGGVEFFDRNKYHAANLNILFQRCHLPHYHQIDQHNGFEAGLSIIDVMMFNSPETINTMLDSYECL